MTFGQKLRQARKQRGFTQKEFAELIQVKHNSVSNWENDQNKPDLDTVRRICAHLGVSLSYLLEEGEAGPEALNRALSKIEFALFDAVRELSEADKQDILDFVRFKAEQKEKRRNE